MRLNGGDKSMSARNGKEKGENKWKRERNWNVRHGENGRKWIKHWKIIKVKIGNVVWENLLDDVECCQIIN